MDRNRARDEGNQSGESACAAGCLSCKHCGSKLRKATSPRGEEFQIIRCDHPDWENEETTMREIDSEFGEECSSYEQNDQVNPPTAGK